MLAQHVVNFAGLLPHLFFCSGSTAHFGRRERRMEVHDDAGVAALQRLLLVGLAKEGQRRGSAPRDGLDDIRNDLLARGRVEVFHALCRRSSGAPSGRNPSVGHAPELAPAEREEVFKVRRRLGVMRQLLRLVVAQAQVLVLDTQTLEPLRGSRCASS